jgi:hypothetical protein
VTPEPFIVLGLAIVVGALTWLGRDHDDRPATKTPKGRRS